jgi:hypothetical protein
MLGLESSGRPELITVEAEPEIVSPRVTRASLPPVALENGALECPVRSGVRLRARARRKLAAAMDLNERASSQRSISTHTGLRRLLPRLGAILRARHRPGQPRLRVGADRPHRRRAEEEGRRRGRRFRPRERRQLGWECLGRPHPASLRARAECPLFVHIFNDYYYEPHSTASSSLMASYRAHPKAALCAALWSARGAECRGLSSLTDAARVTSRSAQIDPASAADVASCRARNNGLPQRQQ